MRDYNELVEIVEEMESNVSEMEDDLIDLLRREVIANRRLVWLIDFVRSQKKLMEQHKAEIRRQDKAEEFARKWRISDMPTPEA